MKALHQKSLKDKVLKKTVKQKKIFEEILNSYNSSLKKSES